MTQQFNGFQEELGTLKDDIKQIHEDLSSLAKGLTHEGKKEWKLARKFVTKKAANGVESVTNAFHDVAEKGEDVVSTIQDEIGKRPLTSFAAALGVGYLLGKLLGRD